EIGTSLEICFAVNRPRLLPDRAFARAAQSRDLLHRQALQKEPGDIALCGGELPAVELAVNGGGYGRGPEPRGRRISAAKMREPGVELPVPLQCSSAPETRREGQEGYGQDRHERGDARPHPPAEG